MVGMDMNKIKAALFFVLPAAGILCVCAATSTSAHDPITTKITWDREIVRIIDSRCTTCHQDGGKAFSLTTYNDARPWAQAILEETLDRQMPPWGAVKGFGQFSNDEGITQDELDIIANWVDGGAPEGDPKDLPKETKAEVPAPLKHEANEIMVSGEYKLAQPVTLKGLWPKSVSDKTSLQITAELPDGSIVPLVWLEDYQKDFDHPFLFETPLSLPAGTAIHGVPADASVALMPGSAKAEGTGRAEGSN
jgi:hypothetical protein